MFLRLESYHSGLLQILLCRRLGLGTIQIPHNHLELELVRCLVCCEWLPFDDLHMCKIWNMRSAVLHTTFNTVYWHCNAIVIITGIWEYIMWQGGLHAKMLLHNKKMNKISVFLDFSREYLHKLQYGASACTKMCGCAHWPHRHSYSMCICIGTVWHQSCYSTMMPLHPIHPTLGQLTCASQFHDNSHRSTESQANGRDRYSYDTSTDCHCCHTARTWRHERAHMQHAILFTLYNIYPVYTYCMYV